MTIISDSFGRIAKSCFSPYLRISILLFDKITFVRLVIRSFGLLCRPSWIRFSIIKLLNFLSCLTLISTNLFDVKRLIENLIKDCLIQEVDSSSFDNTFTFKTVKAFTFN